MATTIRTYSPAEELALYEGGVIDYCMLSSEAVALHKERADAYDAHVEEQIAAWEAAQYAAYEAEVYARAERDLAHAYATGQIERSPC